MSLDPNLGMVERIATALGPLRTRVIFVGGTATGLLITDPMAPAIRATKDVDVIVEVATHGGYYQIEKAGSPPLPLALGGTHPGRHAHRPSHPWFQ